MERILSNRLNWWLESENKLPVSLSFRRRFSYINNLAILYVEILRDFQTDISVIAAFLDIKAVYDNVVID